MRKKSGIILLVLSLLVGAWLLYSRLSAVDLGITDKVRRAEEERHGYVISPNFHRIKEALINAHRDHWVDVAKQESKARQDAILAGAMLLLLSGAFIQFVRNSPPKNKPNNT